MPFDAALNGPICIKVRHASVLKNTLLRCICYSKVN
ncbi:hypothetical protein T10_5590 [Trichinella papuae]|uniref:Uncharacterized protein n=1 Tax=Trichinella papuae TaxID=268474 RepID=A0A0V1LY14_9BILA|nr:hypothetical protein T10_5590 [Trichinella papuae]